MNTEVQAKHLVIVLVAIAVLVLAFVVGRASGSGDDSYRPSHHGCVTTEVGGRTYQSCNDY